MEVNCIEVAAKKLYGNLGATTGRDKAECEGWVKVCEGR